MDNKKNELKARLLEAIHGKEVATTHDFFPVDFDGAYFMFDGIDVVGFGEIIGCCSEGLLSLSKDNPQIKLFVCDAVRRFLTGDFGDATPEETKRSFIEFHEGLATRSVYVTNLLNEGKIYLDVEEACGENAPRYINALLPSEAQAIQEWLERNPEKRHDPSYEGAYFLSLN